MKPAEILERAIVRDGANLTLRRYMTTLLQTLWKEGESFSGKRPLGDGGWQSLVYSALIECGACDGHVEDGEPVMCEYKKADRVMRECIEELCRKKLINEV